MPDVSDFPDDMTIGEARGILRELVKGPGGHACPICTQHAQVYRWSLYASAVAMLMRMHHLGGTAEFVESKAVKVPGQGGDATRLRFWGLVEQEKERRPDGGRSGWWRVTTAGSEFVRGLRSIPKYAYTYDGRCLELGGSQVTVRDALGKSFDYDKMLRGEF